MGLIKTGLIVGGVLLGVGVVGGITAGVVSSRQSDTNLVPDSTNSSKKPPKPISPNQMQGDEPIATVPVTVDTIISQLKETNVSVYESGTKKERKDFYAFNIKPNNLKLDLEKEFSDSFKVDLSLNAKANTVEKLNQGVLFVTTKVSETKQEGTFKEIILELTGFKKGDETLENLLDETPKENSQKTNKNYSLTLTNKSISKNQYTTIDQFNKEKVVGQGHSQTDFWNQWISNSTIGNNQQKDLYIEGKVKVSSLEKDEEHTYFVLKSALENEHLKLIKKLDGKSVGEILLSQVKTTNLLANDLSLYPTKKDDGETTKFLTQLKMVEQEEMKKYLLTNSDPNLSRDISVMVNEMMDRNTDSVQVFIKPSVIKDLGDKASDITLEAKLSFGTGEYVTTFDTSKDAKLLADAGFSFHLYSKKLEGKVDQMIKPEDITAMTNKLQTYFKTSNFTMPLAKNSNISDKSMNGGFDVAGPIKTDLNTNLKFAAMQENMAKNFIVFADYSYTGIDMQKVLFTPSISLIHLDKKTSTEK